MHFSPVKGSNKLTALLAWAVSHDIDLDQIETSCLYREPIIITFYHGRLNPVQFRHISEAVDHTWELGVANWLEAYTKLPNGNSLQILVAGAVATFPVRINIIHTPWDDGTTVRDIIGRDLLESK